MTDKCEDCGECCIRTEMFISRGEINTIKKQLPQSLKKKNFVFKNDTGFFQLKNVDNHCVFFDPTLKLCKIYDYRPQGCKFYPLIYNMQNNNCIFDRDCPRTSLFYQDKVSLREKCDNLKAFLKKSFNIKLK